MPSGVLYSNLKIMLHCLLNHGSVLKEVVRGIVRRSIRDHIDDHSGQDGLLLWSITCVNLKDALWLYLVLERGLKVQLKTVGGPALDHGQSRIWGF